ncbi:hypothetical protein X874_4750 [Mannheimia varigena USDA-ARS-USMARC-1312]|uniref:Uncharacterized protein n=1 Tax=Mannheimia varigena USDA-ARS-USMARC-1296 TaxID=1433287 RepID=W0Q7X5_9PAST|nr:hypothetical protein X808_4660 [Mannheimia varigena USDA-ARS-USMARC-1296]AHG77111.1 hypothetical protein X874_4750 [Mannheimia varigena USDA-ARS-USMARC-1312]AHG80226.1 hypothetical protein X875_16080 [Mannheimia varigena USDA-ARS-USMARC-1388]
MMYGLLNLRESQKTFNNLTKLWLTSGLILEKFCKLVN